MQGLQRGTKGTAKGAPSGLVISLLVHAGAFVLAGMLVVFTVTQKEEKKFVPPKPVDRPKMKLKKPKVKVRKSARPKQTQRIVTKVQRADMPDIQLPEMSGMSEGMVGDIGGFELLPEIEGLTLLGSGQTIGNDFEGTFYDLKRSRSGSPLTMSSDEAHAQFKEFLEKGWKKSVLARYYQSPRKIYTTTFMVPPVRANLAPEIFNEETEGWAWCIYFEGELVSSKDIKFRFWGNGLQLMAVRVDREIVLLSCFEKDSNYGAQAYYGHIWQSDAAENRQYPLGLFKSHVGDWIELKANEPRKMEVIYGIGGGGIFNAMLCVEVEGEEYPRSPYLGGPILPIFKTAPMSRDLQEVIGAELYPGFGSFDGPVFCDYGVHSADAEGQAAAAAAAPEPLADPEPAADPMRLWTTEDGRQFEAEYLLTMGNTYCLQTPAGQKLRIPVGTLSAEDIKYIDLLEPPECSIEFSKTSRQRMEMPNITEVDTTRPIRRFDYVFGARVKQKGMKPYSYPLTIEYYAVGEEVDGNNFVLLDRRQSTFTPTKENEMTHEFTGDEVDVMTWAMTATRPMHGTRYGGFLITVSNERGEIIRHKASHDFLLEHIENLKNVPVGKHFDKRCIRTAPPRPTEDDIYVDSY